MAGLRLLTLGPPRLERDGRPIALSLRRAAALLVYLAVVNQPRTRDTLTALLWPASGEREARGRLRRTLHRLTQLVGEEILLAEGETLRLAPAAGLWLDSLAFEQLASGELADQEARDAPADDRLARLTGAAALYTDDFLAGFSLDENPAWDEWQFLQREQLRQTWTRVLRALVKTHGDAGRWTTALGYAQRWLALDPLHEPAHRTLMRLYAYDGQQSAALRQYEQCVRVLEKELGLAPTERTTALYQAIRAKHLGPARPAVRDSGSGSARRPESSESEPAPTAPIAEPAAPSRLVGRGPALVELQRYFDLARNGARQFVFVTGEAGLGKSALVETFLRALGPDRVRVGHGQCLERLGAGEAYLPILEALGRLCRQPGGEAVVSVLARQAPTWLIQMPRLVSETALQQLRQQSIGATRERMLREMVEALEALSARQPLVLVLEDLHWSDHSTVDLLAWLARRREPARLLVIGLYRPTETGSAEHPFGTLARELGAYGLSHQLTLPYLSAADVAQLLSGRFPGAALPNYLAQELHRRTDGNPLFLVNVLDSWLARGLMVEVDGSWNRRAGPSELTDDLPANLRLLIENQLGRIDPDDLALLEAASVVGREFAAAAAAAGLERSEEQVEARCTALARQGRLLREAGVVEWPDGTIAGQFAFTQQLYQQVIYDRIPVGRRVRLHRQIGARLEAAGGDSPQPAGSLAAHFVRGRDAPRAVPYLQLAAEQALQRSAQGEAIEHLTRGLELLRSWPAGLDRARQELQLQALLAPTLVVARGWGSTGARRAYLRARELCTELGDPPLRYQIEFGLAALHEWRGEYEQSQALIKQQIRLLDRRRDAPSILESYDLLACSLFHLGSFEPALDEANQGLTLYQPARQYELVASFGEDPGVGCHGWAALALCCLGRADQALERVRVALELASQRPHSLAAAQVNAATVYQLRQEAEPCRQWAAAAIALGEAHGFPYRVAVGTILRGWAQVALGQAAGIEALWAGLEASRATGARLDEPYFLGLLGDACNRTGRIEEGLACLDRALDQVAHNRSFFYEAELYRLSGVLRLQTGAPGAVEAAERSFQQALETARRQQARSLERRAAASLAQLWLDQGRAAEAAGLLQDRGAGLSGDPDRQTAQPVLDQVLDPAEQGRSSREGAPA